MYYYESHLTGDIYTTKEQIPFEELYCECCGDYDWEYGWYEEPLDFIEAHPECKDRKFNIGT